MANGVILIDKKEGLTSRQEVNNVSRALKEKKAGHIGTLDPFATGLLVVLLGEGTKISPFLEEMDKTYIATLKLGNRTDTQDLTGTVIEEKEIPVLSKQLIQEIFSTFIGEYKQVPPMYSALKKDGVPLYKLARQGIEIERKERLVHIFSLDLLSFEKDEISFIAHVSKGTYIRTLGEDIALKLNTVGHLISLRRVQVGPYKIENAKTSDAIKESDLISIEDSLSFMDKYFIKEEDKKLALNGARIRIDNKGPLVLVKDENGPIAIYKKDHDNIYKSMRGFR